MTVSSGRPGRGLGSRTRPGTGALGCLWGEAVHHSPSTNRPQSPVQPASGWREPGSLAVTSTDSEQAKKGEVTLSLTSGSSPSASRPRASTRLSRPTPAGPGQPPGGMPHPGLSAVCPRVSGSLAPGTGGGGADSARAPGGSGHPGRAGGSAPGCGHVPSSPRGRNQVSRTHGVPHIY